MSVRIDARAVRLAVASIALLGGTARLVHAQLATGDIVVVDWLDGHSRVLRVDPGTGERTLIADLTTHGPNGTWPAAPHARGIVVGDPNTLYVVVQTEEFDPTDPHSSANGLNCYPFPFPAQTCGALIKINVQTKERTLVEDFGDPAQADPTLPSSQALGAWPIAAIVQPNTLLVVDKDSPTRFHAPNPRLGAVWRVPISGADAWTRYLLSDFSDATQGPIGVDPFAIARDPSGRVLVLDRAAVGTGIVDCNTSVGSTPDGCGAVFQIDPDGTRHLVTDLGDASEGPTSQAEGGIGISINNEGRIFVLSQTGGGSGCPLAASNGSCGVVFELHPDPSPTDPYRHSRTIFSNLGDPGEGPTDAGVFGLAVGADGRLLVTGCAGLTAHGGIPSVCAIDPSDPTGQRLLLSDFGDPLQQPGLPNQSHTPLPLGVAVVLPEEPATTTALTAAPSAATYGQSVTLTAQVTSSAGTPSGQLEFIDGGTVLATLTLAGGTASTTTSALAAGLHTLRADYLGEPGFGPSTGTTALVVSPASTAVTLASSVNPAAPGQLVTFTATLTPQFGGTPTGTITFRDGPTVLGTIPVAGGEAGLDTGVLALGSHGVTATYDGDANFASSVSPPLVQVIGSAADLGITIVATPPQAAVASSVMLTATVVNNGPADATAVVARVTLAPGLAFVTADGAYDGATGNWTVGSVAHGASATLQIVATLVLDSPSITARIASADQGDPNPANDAVTVTIPLPGIYVGIAGCTLRNAIVAANTDAPSGGCPSGRPGVDTVFLPPNSSHVYSDVYETPDGIGPDALPAVTSPIVIEGRGALVARNTSFGTPTIRVFFVKKGGSLTLRNVTVANGVGSGGGGGILLEGAGASLVVDSSRIINNSATDFGGGISSGRAGVADDGDITITNSLVAGNRALPGTFVGFGGGIYAGASLTVIGSTIGPGTVDGVGYPGNFAGRSGGGIFTQGPTTIRGSFVMQNVSDNGGGITNTAVATLEETVVSANVANVVAGGIRTMSTGITTITRGTLTGNQALDGGALFNSGRTTLIGVTVSQNLAPTAGGLDNRGFMALSGSRVTQNTAATQAGGILNLFTNDFGPGAQLAIDNTIVSANVTGGGGGGILTWGPVTLVNSTIGGPTDADGNTAAKAGGGILVSDGGAGPASVTMTGGSVSRNVANGKWSEDGGGGGIANGDGHSGPGQVTLVDVTIADNRAPNEGEGGGIFNRGTLNVTRGAIFGNAAGSGMSGSGGGIGNGSGAFSGGTVTLAGTTLSSNTAVAYGGAISSRGTVQVKGGFIIGNHAVNGGAIGNLHEGSTTLIDVGLDSNAASGSGGHLYTSSSGSVTVDGGSLRNGDALLGGGIFAASTLTVRNGTVIGSNTATYGAGLWLSGTSAILILDATVRDNHAAGYGGGIYAADANDVTIRGSSLTSNFAPDGGGMWVLRSGSPGVVLIDSTVSDNDTDPFGTSALAVLEGGLAEVVNSTISRNSGEGTYLIFNAGAMSIRSSTIVDNRSGFGLFSSAGSSMALSNTIVAGNHRSPGAATDFLDCYVPRPGEPPSTIASSGYNLMGLFSGCPRAGVGDLFVRDEDVFTAVLAPLADNGGPTPTYALLPGSPALDTANPFTFGLVACEGADQRGMPRPVDGDGNGNARCDIGAFEQQTPLASPLPAIESVSPNQVPVGGPAFTLQVVGTGFVAGSIVLWNGEPQATTFAGPTELLAAIPASAIPSSREFTTVFVTVVNPGGLVSVAVPILIDGPAVDHAATFWGLPGSTATFGVPPAGVPPAPGEGGLSVAAANNTPGSGLMTVNIATYKSNPVSSTTFSTGSAFFDLQVIGADATDVVTARFYYPDSVVGATEASLALLYWTGAAWAGVIGSGGAPVVKDTTDDLDGTTSGGRFTVTLDDTSIPRITDLGGTVFAVATVGIEASVSFNPVTRDVEVRGPAGATVSVVLGKGERARDGELDNDSVEMRTYRIVDPLGDVLELKLAVERSRHRIHAAVVSLQYGSDPVTTAPPNALRFVWSGQGETLEWLEQTLAVGAGRHREEMVATFNRAKNRTVIHVTGAPPQVIVKPGLVLLELATDHGNITVVPPTPGARGADPSLVDGGQGSGWDPRTPRGRGDSLGLLAIPDGPAR